MFIVNQDGDTCELINKVFYYTDYDSEVKAELIDIEVKTRNASYHFGSTQRAEQVAKQRQIEYLEKHKCEKVLYLVVHGNNFAKYYDIKDGEKVFNHILNSIEHDRTLVDLSKLHIFNL